VLGIEVVRYPWLVNIRPTQQLDEYTFLSGDPDGVYQIWHWDPEVMNFHKTKDTTPKRQPEEWPGMAKRRQKSVEASAEGARKGAAVREANLQERLGNEMMVIAGGGALSLGLDEASLMACIVEPGAVDDILDCQLEVALAQMEGIASRGIKVVLGGSDMAYKNGPLYSPRMFRDFILPRLKKLSARCNELGLHYVWRTDGNIWSVSDMIFAEAGIPGYGEVDRDATMELGKIHDRFPNVVVWANVSGHTMRRGSRDEVYDNCMEILEESNGKRYFHGVSNTILPGTPPENVWAMMEARNDYGFFCISPRKGT
jgi:uroporphyrinogen decarboxylase